MIEFILALFIIVFTSQVLDLFKVNKFINIFVSIFSFLFFTYEITYTADWVNYLYVFEDQEQETKDFFIRFITLKFEQWGLEYKHVFRFHIIVIAVLFTLFANKFLKNSLLLVIICFLIADYVPVVNQIRYFVAFGLYLFSVYYFYIRKYRLFGLFTVLAFLNHIGIIPLYLILLFIRKDVQTKIYIAFSIIVYTVVYAVLNINILQDAWGFEAYLQEEMKSTLLGGIFKMLPSILVVILLYYTHKKSTVEKDDEMQFLYRLSLFPIIFIPSITLTQVVGDRYVFNFIIIWIIFIVRNLKINNKNMLLQKVYVILIVFIVWYLVYILPFDVFGESPLLDEFIQSYESRFKQ